MIEFVMVAALCQPLTEGCGISNVRLRVFPSEAVCQARLEPVKAHLDRKAYALQADKLFCVPLSHICEARSVKAASLNDFAPTPRKDVSEATRSLLCQ